MPAEPRHRRRGTRRLLRARDALLHRRARLERWLERRHPALWDARHAVEGVGRLLGPLIGAAVLLVLLAPLLALLAALAALLDVLDLDLPSISLPSVPSVDAPGWLRDVARVLGDVLGVLGQVLRWAALAGGAAYGIHLTRRARRRRLEAEAVGREELLRRLLAALDAIAVQHAGGPPDALLGSPDGGDGALRERPARAAGATGPPPTERRGARSTPSTGPGPSGPR
ncbi:hypothetical protein SK069_13720 [Patulibacter brassicae]|uniref:Uncharacterized protein n=1 Tax=Patulibacter brassicae TaxID=1705717 RepID=A0ABU4VNM3_9ACTN|nr:hypothetical protein [Patulibacter brassicae]MDX8152659.1 hypothetical protein [Patulibacter brassicae]